MQTFLPYKDFHESARVLDRARLGKQRVENLQILKAMLGLSKGWSNHPAVKMWEGCEVKFLEYHWAICGEWTDVRGYKDTCREKFELLLLDHYPDHSNGYGDKAPQWLGDEDFHRAHQSNLLRKDPDYYGQFFEDVPDDLEYVWPNP